MLTDIKRLNAMLGNHPKIGWTPEIAWINGRRQPQYRWMRTEELTYPALVDPAEAATPLKGLSIILDAKGMPFNVGAPKYTMVRQYPEDRWCIAFWQAPIGYEMWYSRYGAELEWPRHGQWLVTDLVFEQGIYPTEQLTNDVIAAVTELRIRNYDDYLNMLDSRDAAREQRLKNTCRDMVYDALPEFVGIPGKRGGSTSWGGSGFERTEI